MRSTVRKIQTVRVPCAISTTLCGQRARRHAPCSKMPRRPNGACPRKNVPDRTTLSCMPGMVYAAIERPPVMGASLKTCDDAEAKKVKGVEQVVMLDLAKPPYGFKPLGGAAVIANNSWTALQGRKKLKVEWDLGEHAAYDSAAYKQAMLD